MRRQAAAAGRAITDAMYYDTKFVEFLANPDNLPLTFSIAGAIGLALYYGGRYANKRFENMLQKPRSDYRGPPPLRPGKPD